MVSYKLRNMPIFIMIAILPMACGHAAITQSEQEAITQPEITPLPPTVGLIDGEEAQAVAEQKEEHLSPTPTVSVDESEEETFTSPLPTSTTAGGTMVEETGISTVVTATIATSPANTATVTATRVLTTGSEGWRTENIEAEGIVELALPAALSAQSEQKTARNFFYPAISPNNQYLLMQKRTGVSIPCQEGSENCLSPISDLWLYDFAAGQWQPLVPSAIRGTWSPDGQRIAYLAQVGPGRHDLQYLSLADGITHTVTTDALRSQLYWRDNQRLVYLGPGGYVTQIKVDGSDKQTLSTIPTNGNAVDFALSRNGSQLAIVDGRQLWIVDLETPQEPILISPEEEERRYASVVQGVVWSSDGQYLAYTSGHYSITIYDKTGQFISNFVGGDPAHSLAWSPDNRSIAFISNFLNVEGNVETDIVIRNIDGVESEAFAREIERKHTLAWSPDGSYIVWGTSSSEIGPPRQLDLKIR